MTSSPIASSPTAVHARPIPSSSGPTPVTTSVSGVTARPKPDVLIVDDEPQVREIVATYLEREGFSVRSAADGREALAELAMKRPDAMVLDLMLPEVSGLDVLQKLRARG